MTATNTERASTVHSYAHQHARAAALADIRRAASLEDIRLEVSVAHTNQRLRARFCVMLRRGRRASWAFGVDIKEAKEFASQLAQLAKSHKRGKCPCHVVVTGDSQPHKHEISCPMCAQLRRELKCWPKFPAFSTVGKRHLDAKCALLTELFSRVFRVLSRNAQWLQSCALLRELLRMTEALCKIQYEDDSEALQVIESLTRVTPLIDTSRGLTAHHDASNQDSDCSICLGSLFEPAETTTADSSECDEHSKSSELTQQPSQGVELPCGHRFHDSCVCLWFHTRLNCPVCRQEPTVQATIESH